MANKNTINQKEYLMRYLGKDPSVKKKRKKKTPDAMKVKIIDDDVDDNGISLLEDLLEGNEDAPQIVAVVDERPPSMRIDELTRDKLWQPIGAAVDLLSAERPTVNKFRINKPAVSNILSHYTPSQKPTKKAHIQSDLSPTRKNRHDSPDHLSPKRRRRSSDSSPPRARHIQDKIEKNGDNKPRVSSPDLSPPRHRYNTDRPASSPDQSPPRRRPDAASAKMTKTLDGKRAGLQKASELVSELQQFKKREDELFSQLSAEASGQNAAAVKRDRKTGKIRDIEEEARQQQKKQEEESKRKEKYSRWGKGLKQMEDSEKKMAETLHEMNKPLARYADDKDLETYLKEQDREGDPMLMYMRQKKKSKAKEDPHYAEKPVYMGEFMPNRYGICPGHRWDGVDRSNGYESKFFQVENDRKAQLEDSHKWSTEDM